MEQAAAHNGATSDGGVTDSAPRGAASVYVVLAVLFGVLTTLIVYRGYGVRNQVEQLPVIIRALDGSFLPNDFFTNASTESVARSYYAAFVAWLAGAEPRLPLVALTLTLLANVLRSLVTLFLARDLFRGSWVEGITASALVMSVPTFNLGDTGFNLYASYLTPTTIALPLAMIAIWAAARGRLALAVALASLASLLHALIGLEVGGLLLGAALILAGLGRQGRARPSRREWGASAAILMVAALFSLVPQLTQQTIGGDRFIYILAHFRHPHHYIPSTFGLVQYLLAGAFLAMTALLYLVGRRSRAAEVDAWLVVIAMLVLFLCLGGYVFVELVPLRIWVTAQSFRLLFVVKWFGLLLAAGFMVWCASALGWVVMAPPRVGSPHAAIGSAMEGSSAPPLARNRRLFTVLLVPLFLGLVLLALFRSAYFLSFVYSLLLYLGLIVAANRLEPRAFRLCLVAFLLVLAMSGVLLGQWPAERLPQWAYDQRARFSAQVLSELGPDADKVVAWVRSETPPDAVVLTPPDWGQFRLLARRAIVVDFKAFPFGDRAMLQWYERLTDCYGHPTRTGFAMVPELQRAYAAMDDERLGALAARYAFDYAVLYAETTTTREVLFENGAYKVVLLAE